MDNILQQIALNDVLEWSPCKDNKGIQLKHLKYNTVICVTWSALEKYNIDQLLNFASCGYNVTGITRVTGYFSTTGNWNKGKIGELKDRLRSDL